MTIRKIIQQNQENLITAFVGLVCWPMLVALLTFHFMFQYSEGRYKEGKEEGIDKARRDGCYSRIHLSTLGFRNLEGN